MAKAAITSELAAGPRDPRGYHYRRMTKARCHFAYTYLPSPHAIFLSFFFIMKVAPTKFGVESD